jgi:hypothetical protein
MIPKSIIRVCFELSTLYTIFLSVAFVVKRTHVVPLTFRSTVHRWGALKDLMKESPLSLDQAKFGAVLADWCPDNNNSNSPPVSPQCSCIRAYSARFENNSATFLRGGGPKDLAALGELQAKGVLDACLRQRGTWRRETCEHFCQVPLVMPLLVSSLCMSLFFSRIVEYRPAAFAVVAAYLPLLLAALVITVSLVWDPLGAIPAVLTVLSLLMEMAFTHHFADDAKAYWSFQRYFMGSVAVWAAISHQGRDLYVAMSYAALGFFAGMLGYAQYVLRHKQCCNARLRVVSIYIWVGVCAIAVCFLLLVQQHWYPVSPVWSSTVSVACLAFACLQCIAMAPGLYLPSTVQVMIGFSLLSVGVVSVAVDVLVVSE